MHTWRSWSFASRTLLSPVLSDDSFAAAFILENHSWNSCIDSMESNKNKEHIEKHWKSFQDDHNELILVISPLHPAL